MWIREKRGLRHVTDASRMPLEFRASKEKLEAFDEVAERCGSFRNYVIENGLQNLLQDGNFVFDKKSRPKDRMRYRSTFNKELVAQVQSIAKEHKLYVGDIVEMCYEFVKEDHVLSEDHRYRVE